MPVYTSQHFIIRVCVYSLATVKSVPLCLFVLLFVKCMIYEYVA